jgi:hypothetical protein
VDELFGASRATEAGRGGPPPPRGPRPPRGKSRRPLILIGLLLLLALTAAGVWAAASGLLPIGGARGGDAVAPDASAPAIVDPSPSATSTMPADPAASALPASCSELYSDAMLGKLDGLALSLNPDWVVTTEPGPPAAEPVLTAILTSAANLDCYWVPAEGPSNVGIATSVTAVSEQQAQTVEATLTSEGYTVIEELGSRRFVREFSGPDGASGFSHIVRDGVWFATQWTNAPVTGYTADMVEQVFG